MQIVDILVLATVALVLLGGLVALGLGHRRWSIGTVVAGFLVLVSAATFLYLAARVAARDRAWKQKIDDYEVRLAKAVDDRSPDDRTPGWEEGPNSLARLRERRDRWQRALDRIDTWHGRVWQNASFEPPKDDTMTGKIVLAPYAKAEDSPPPPIGVGSRVFLFDTLPFEQGGLYIGEFRVQSLSFDQEKNRYTVTVVQTAPRDDYDRKVLAQPHESVTVFEDLPVDRWLAFYRSPTLAEDGGEGSLPEAVKGDADTFRELLDSSPEVKRLVEDFLKEHEKIVPEDQWKPSLQEAAERPGTLWADVTFTKPYAFTPAAEAQPPESDDAPAGPDVASEYAAGSRATVDLQTAFELRKDDVVTIDRVFRRRPLMDAMTMLHGTDTKKVNDKAGSAEGATVLRQLLENEITALQRSNTQLEDSRNVALDNAEDERQVAGELERDLASWRRDVAAAADLAAALEREVDQVSRALRAAEAAIVANGRELTTAMDRLAREIDRVAPPPERRAARP